MTKSIADFSFENSTYRMSIWAVFLTQATENWKEANRSPRIRITIMRNEQANIFSFHHSYFIKLYY